MNWLEHPVLKQRQAKQPPALGAPAAHPTSTPPPLTPADTDDALTNPGDFE